MLAWTPPARRPAALQSAPAIQLLSHLPWFAAAARCQLQHLSKSSRQALDRSCTFKLGVCRVQCCHLHSSLIGHCLLASAEHFS